MKSLVLKVVAFFLFTWPFIDSRAFALGARQSRGLTISALTGMIQNQYGSSGFGVEQVDLTYFPRYNFVENDNSSISIGWPVSVELRAVAMSMNGGGEMASSSDLPAVLEYNIGFKSTMDNDPTFGVYVGMGLGFCRVAIPKNDHLGDDGFLMALYSGLEYA